MINTYFKNWSTGRLQRLPYLGYHVLIIAIFVAILFATIAAASAVQNLVGGDIATTQKMLEDKFGMAGILGGLTVGLLFMVAVINIEIKRIRDMGLPPFITLIVLVVVSFSLNLLFPGVTEVVTATAENASAVAVANTPSAIASGFSTLVFLCLLFIPSNTFGSK